MCSIQNLAWARVLNRSRRPSSRVFWVTTTIFDRTRQGTVDAYVRQTLEEDAGARNEGVRLALYFNRKAGDIKAAGFIIVNASANAVGNRNGLFAYNRSTNANYTLTVRTDDGTGSGWAGGEHPDWKQIDFGGMAQRAITKARLSRNPVAIEPGRYTVILEPQAVGDLVQLMGFALNARTADEGRSAFAKQGGGNKIGEKIVDPRITIFSDPQDPQLLEEMRKVVPALFDF